LRVSLSRSRLEILPMTDNYSEKKALIIYSS
jgi:hypothetical protein